MDEPDITVDRFPWRVQLVLAVLLGAIGAAAALAFVALVSIGDNLLWTNSLDPEAFSGPVKIVVIMTVGGFLVGLIHALVPAEEENVFEALATGNIALRPIPGALAIALVTLVTGFSLGPEVPTGMAAAGLAGWLASRRNATPEQSEVATRAAITGAWGGLFTAPFTAVLLIVELNTGKRLLSWNRLAIDATAAAVGFAIFFSVTSGWSDVLRLLDLPRYSLEPWNVAVAVGLGILGALFGTMFKLITLGTRRLAVPLAGHPIARCTLAGVVLGLVGMALPLTLFLGTEGLRQVTEDPKALGTGLILASLVVKMIATSGALSFGFVGGPVFPLLFVGGSLGVVVNDIAPGIPLALAVTGLMAAVPASVIPIPFSLSVLTVLIAGVGPTEISAVFVAAVVGLIAGQLFESALRRRSSEETPESVQIGPTRDESA